jgi:uncharacterized protein (TIGR02271 family)
MDGERLELARGARVVARDGEVGLLTHAVADRETRDATELVVAHDGIEWLIPLRAVTRATPEMVELRGSWNEMPAARFEPASFERVEHFMVHRTVTAQAARAQIELREEELIPRTEWARAGTVEVGKRVVGDTQTIEVPIAFEQVTVERRRVEPRPADGPIGDGRVLRIPVHRERVSVEKVPVVVEEVAVGKRTVEDTRVVEDTVRREEAVVETQGAIEAVTAEEGVAR